MRQKSFFSHGQKEDVVFLLYFETMKIFQINPRAVSNDV